MNKKNAIAIAAVLAVGLTLGVAILRGDKHGADGHDEHGHEHAEEATHAGEKPAAAASAPAVEAPHARFSDEQLRHNGIALASAGPARIATRLQLLGEVKLNQDRAVIVTPRLAGLVEVVRANAGDHVKRGQVLAIISSPALADQRSDLLTAQKRLALARTTHDREKKLWEDKISAEQDFLAARQAMQEAEIAVENARQRLAAFGASAGDPQGLTRHEIRSPIDGIVVDKKLSIGEALKEDAAAFHVADLSSVWVELTVPAKDINQLAEGMTAQVKATAFEAQGTARLSYVGALVGEQSRSATARLVLANPKGLWRPGLPVTVALTASEVDAPVAVAADAVQVLDGARVVFVRQGQQFDARRVETGRSDGSHVEVTKGLNAGDRYAAKNSFLVKAEIGKAAAEHAH